jgi:hypothetical protein
MKPTELRPTNVGHMTQWAAQFAVASELCKRGHEVAFTLGHNTPLADLMVISPSKAHHFLIDVKGLKSKNPWLVKRKQPRNGLFYVLAFVPEAGANRYFVLTQAEANKLVETHLASKAGAKGWDGFKFEAPNQFENKWNRLPK